MDRQLLVETATLAGEIMLTSGAETFRVEDTVGYILRKGGGGHAMPLALTTALLVTLEDEGEEPLTIVRRIKIGSTNLSKVVQVNEISRAYCNDELTLEEANQKLKQIKGKEYTRCLYNLATVCVAAGFALFFGGGWLEFLVTIFTGSILALCITLTKIAKWNSIIQTAFSCAVSVFAGLMVKHFVPSLDADIVMISTIMVMAPGVAMTNGVRDTLQGDYISGGARMMEAFVRAAAIAVGAGIGIALANLI